jgi:pilus assembly protein Flp/PilA
MLKSLMNHFIGLLRDEKGQGMVEYALIIALVAILLIAGLIAFKDQIAAVFTSITTALSGV